MLNINPYQMTIAACIVATHRLGYWTSTAKERRFQVCFPKSTRLSRWIGFAAALALFIAAPFVTNAQVVFQADFNGAGAGTGGTNNIVTLGGTGSLVSGQNMTASIGTANPLFVGEPGYLYMVDSGSGANGGVTIYPSSAATCPDSWFVLQSGTMAFDTVNGGLDFFFSDSVATSAWVANAVSFRPLDVGQGNSGGLRLIINATRPNVLQLELIAKNSAGTTVQDVSISGTVIAAANTLCHVAVTLSTNPVSGLITTKLFFAPGNTPINTSSTASLVVSGTTTAALLGTGTNAVSHAFNAASGFGFGQPYSNGPDVKNLSFGCLRVYNAVPSVFPAVTYLPDMNGATKPNPEPALPSTFEHFSPPVVAGGAPAANTPVAGEWIRTGDPGDCLVVAGNQLSSYTGADAAKDSMFLTFGENPSFIDNVQADIEREQGNNATIRLDTGLPSPAMYFVWPRNANGYGAPMAVNRTEAWWIGPDTVAVSNTTSLFGRNLTYSVSGSSSSSAWIYIKPQGTGTGQWVTPIAQNPYKVDFVVPSNLTSGTYEVWAHNGHGEHYGWSGPVLLTVNSGFTWTSTRFNVKTGFGAYGDGIHDDTTAIQNAINASGSSAYSTVYFPTGTYLVSSGFYIPAMVQLLGDGSALSIIKFADSTVTNRAIVTVLYGNPANVWVTNLQLNAGNSKNTWLVNVCKTGTYTSVSGFRMTNCSLIATGTITIPSSTPTVAAFSSGTSYLTVTSATNLFVGESVSGPGLPSPDTIDSISGTTVGLSVPTIAAEPSETINAVGTLAGNPGQGTCAMVPCDHAFFTNCSFVGGAAMGSFYILDSSQVFVDHCYFYGMFDEPLLNIKGYTSQASYTNNVGADYDYYMGYTYNPSTSSYSGDPNGNGWSQGVYFKGLDGEGARHDTYIGNNTSYNMGVRLYYPDGTKRSQTNWGEQISNEYNNSVFYGTPTAATGTSMTFSSSMMTGINTTGALIAIIYNGTGQGQWRDIGSVNTSTGLVTLAAGQSWNVPPDTTSSIALGWYAVSLVSYENNFNGKTDRVGPKGNWGISGILGTASNVVVDSNIYTYCEGGIRNIEGNSERSATFPDPNVIPNYFWLCMNNISQDCQLDYETGGAPSSYTEAGLYTFAQVFRKNTGYDTVAGNTVGGIHLTDGNGETYRAPTIGMVVFDQNYIKDAPLGVYYYDSGNFVSEGNVLFESNTFLLGSGSASGSYGMYVPTGMLIGLGGNTYTGFAATYSGATTDQVLEEPWRTFDEGASLSMGGSAADTVTVWNAGTSPLVWTASSDSTWLTASPATGTVANEDSLSTFTLTCNPSGLSTGLHVGNVTLTSGSQTKKVLVNFTVNP